MLYKFNKALIKEQTHLKQHRLNNIYQTRVYRCLRELFHSDLRSVKLSNNSEHIWLEYGGAINDHQVIYLTKKALSSQVFSKRLPTIEIKRVFDLY